MSPYRVVVLAGILFGVALFVLLARLPPPASPWVLILPRRDLRIAFKSNICDRMTEEQMRDAALYYASLSSNTDYPAKQKKEIAEGASREQKRRSR